MTTRQYMSLLLALLMIFIGLNTALALRPEEVLVVANANAEKSVDLGKYYCLSRNILLRRLVVLHTTSNPAISRKQYEQNIRKPLRRFLAENNLQRQIKCIVLMWGVPVRVLGRPLKPERRGLVSTYKIIQTRMLGRLAVNLKLLNTVGLSFPTPRTNTLKPVGLLFPKRSGEKLKEVPEFRKLVYDFEQSLKDKEQLVANLSDPAKRMIAVRQLLALRLDTYGMKNLLDHLPETKVPAVPTKAELQRDIASAKKELARLRMTKEIPENARKITEVIARLDGLIGVYKFCKMRLIAVDTSWEDASVDSELALLWDDEKRLGGMRPNPMYWRFSAVKTRPPGMPADIVMTSRIDGPSILEALRIIKDSIAVEKTGLKGKFYIDAGGKYPPYDVHLKRLARFVRKHTKIPVVLDTRKSLFRPGSCPDAALYVGWYSLQNYIPSFTWVRGAVGWHIASLEAVHLRTPISNEWCVKMLQNGVAATLGAVNEPYLHAFPLPEDFFALLLTGRFTLAECYWKTVPEVSWRMTLIADPLYNPFKLHPQVSIRDLPAGMVEPLVKGKRSK